MQFHYCGIHSKPAINLNLMVNIDKSHSKGQVRIAWSISCNTVQMRLLNFQQSFVRFFLQYYAFL